MTDASPKVAHPIGGRCSSCQLPVSAPGVIAIALGSAHVCRCGAMLMSPTLSQEMTAANVARVVRMRETEQRRRAEAEAEREALRKALRKAQEAQAKAEAERRAARANATPAGTVSASKLGSSAMDQARENCTTGVTPARQVRATVTRPVTPQLRGVNAGCEAFLRERGVTRLVHVTYQKNLVRILEQGMKPGVPGKDQLRLDGYYGALCFSLMWPNVSMFFKRCCDFPDEVNDHVVIEIGPEMAERDDAAFSTTNAAASVAQIGYGRTALERLFAQSIAVSGGWVDRSDPITVPRQLPTSQQAEVLFTSPIAVQDIVAVHFPTLRSKLRFEALCPEPGVAQRVTPDLFVFWKELCPNMRLREYVWLFKDADRLLQAEPAA